MHPTGKDPIRRHVCKECGSAFAKEFYLRRHTKSIHFKIKDAKCNLCHYTASTEDEVRKHMRNIHVTNKRITCDLCPYKASSKKDVQGVSSLV